MIEADDIIILFRNVIEKPGNLSLLVMPVHGNAATKMAKENAIALRKYNMQLMKLKVHTYRRLQRKRQSHEKHNKMK